MPPVTFRDMIAANRRASTMLVAGFVLFVTLVVLVLAIAVLAMHDPSAVERLDFGRAAAAGGIALAVALAYAAFAYYAGANVILGVSGAREIHHADDPVLFNVVEEMAIAAGVPMPKVYLIDDDAPNAFATGRDPAHGVVAITRGLREVLDRDELQGVMAHEMGHIRNYDIRLMMLLAVLIGLVVMAADLFWQLLRVRGGGRRRDDKDKGGPLVIVLIVVAVVLALLAPLLAQLIQLAVSRRREYLADASAVEFTRNPLGLASALRKLDADPHELESANRGTAHLYIVNPIKQFAKAAETMFASHPPIRERIQRLEALAGPAAPRPVP
jgi:heat shock protein HtpX